MSEAPPSSGVCPICGKPGAPDYRPFCSKRCADIDLSRWLKGVYSIPGTEPETDKEEKDKEMGPEQKAP